MKPPSNVKEATQGAYAANAASNQAIGEQEAVEGQVGDVQAKRAGMLASGMKTIEEKHAAEMQAGEQFRQGIVTEYKGKMDELQRLHDEYSKETVDPGQIWHDGGAPAQITAILAATAGGMMAGRTGGPNQAVQMIDKMMDRSVQTQEANLARKGKNLEAQRSVLADSRAAGLNDAQSRMAAKTMMYESTIKQLQATVDSETAPEMDKLNAKRTMAALEEKKAENNKVLANSVLQLTTQQQMHRESMGAQGAALSWDKQKYADQQTAEAAHAMALADPHSYESRKREADISKTEAEAGKARSEMDKPKNEQTEKYAKDVEDIGKLETTTASLRKSLSESGDAGIGPWGGAVEGAANAAGYIPGAGPLASAAIRGVGTSDKGLNNRQAVSRFNTEMTVALASAKAASAPVDVVSKLQEGLANPNSARSVKNALDAADELIDFQKKKAQAANPEGARLFNERMGGKTNPNAPPRPPSAGPG